jgi:hypothetical protein
LVENLDKRGVEALSKLAGGALRWHPDSIFDISGAAPLIGPIGACCQDIFQDS